MVDNTIGWGQGAVNNTIGWGGAKANNTIGFGSIYDDTPTGDTNITGTGSTPPSFQNTKAFKFNGGPESFQSADDTPFGNPRAEDGFDANIMFSFWIKIDSDFFSDETFSNQDMEIINKHDQSNRLGYKVFLRRATNSAGTQHFRSLRFQLELDRPVGTNNQQSIVYTLNNGEMIGDTVYNVAVGYEKSTRTAKMYVNGNKVKEGTIQGGVGGIEQAFTRFTIGNSSPTANQGFEGVIDEVAVWQHNTATDNISDAEAQAIYNFTSYGGS